MFARCSAEMVVLPSSIEEIRPGAFKIDNLKYIYYEGNDTGWRKITNKFDPNLSQDHYILNAEVYFYSEQEPETEGNFWRYVDGVPTIW